MSLVHLTIQYIYYNLISLHKFQATLLNQSKDTLKADVNKLAKVLAHWDKARIRQELILYEFDEDRMTKVVNSYMEERDKLIPKKNLNSDAAKLKDVFPLFSTNYLIKLLQRYGNSELRIEMVLRRLLAKEISKKQKAATASNRRRKRKLDINPIVVEGNI